ncbi:unnamed protein product, partial [Prunus brigantina]
QPDLRFHSLQTHPNSIIPLSLSLSLSLSKIEESNQTPYFPLFLHAAAPSLCLSLTATSPSNSFPAPFPFLGLKIDSAISCSTMVVQFNCVEILLGSIEWR